MYRIYSDLARNGYIVEQRKDGNWEFVAQLDNLRSAWAIIWNMIK